MPSNYDLISEENKIQYGTAIGRTAPMMLVNRYDDRTHFIFEVLQNAEDSMGRRGKWRGSRKVAFRLLADRLEISHFGRPFDEADVRGVCGIAESTKDPITAIGRFGIGFKSVFAFTDRPQVHSGDEDFAIETFVLPTSTEKVQRDPDETLFVLPLRAEDLQAHAELVKGFRGLGPTSLLFLRNIEEIAWSAPDGTSGLYVRSQPEPLAPNVHRITVIGQESGREEVDEVWLVFNREVKSAEGRLVGRAEVAFSLRRGDDLNPWVVRPIPMSPLVVFFPTVVSTNLGFLVQGPYRTTPSRDNIPHDDTWNKFLVAETADLTLEALRWLRDQEMLGASTLRCLPLDRQKFPTGSRFFPVFEAVRNVLRVEALIPRFGGGYVQATHGKLARTRELRELFSADQIAQLYGGEVSAWITDEITLDREPELRQYLLAELEVSEVTPATLLPRLNAQFLEQQPDAWVRRLYEFLGGQEAVVRRSLGKVPILRLEGGQHVAVRNELGQAAAFLPGPISTGFPTVRAEVCSTPEARTFLINLGVTQPDPVDDVIWNVLPSYQEVVDVEDDRYARDIERIVTAFKAVDSVAQREKLLAALRKALFVMVVDVGDGEKYVAPPDKAYIATDRLKQLFAGVSDVMMVDSDYRCLQGEQVRELLEACGAVRYLRPIAPVDSLGWLEREDLRKKAGHEQTSGQKDQVSDWDLLGLEGLIEHLSTLPHEQMEERSRLLWESLAELEERRGHGVFSGTYVWSYYGMHRATFDSAFVRRLNAAAWIPNASGHLCQPSEVEFDSLGWTNHPFLLSKIVFRPSVVSQLAKEVGIEVAALDLLKRLGITSVADLARAGIATVDSPLEVQGTGTDSDDMSPQLGGDVYKSARDLYGEDLPDVSGSDLVANDGSDDPISVGSSSGGAREGGRHSPSGGSSDSKGSMGSGLRGHRVGSAGKSGAKAGSGRAFVSYLAVHGDEDEEDPDGLDRASRMRVEAEAVSVILKAEPNLNRTAEGNQGFDLFETGDGGLPCRWIEVKAMTGSLDDRPVGLSRAQFQMAQAKEHRYWLYIVEHAGDSSKARILRINNPAGRARTFTFDKGWAQVATG